MSRRRRLYLAGPDVFFPDAGDVGEKKKALCAKFGFEGLFPLDNAIDRDAPPEERGVTIFRANMALLEKADGGVFNLTPFRGPSADVGTAFELGAMFAMDKPCFAYSNFGESFAERSIEFLGHARRDGRGVLRGADGMQIEEFAMADNVMLHAAVLATGGVVRPADGGRLDPDDLRIFTECLKAAQAFFET